MTLKQPISDKIIDWLNFGTYPGSILFVVGYEFDDVLNYLKKRKVPDYWSVAFKDTADLYNNKGSWGYAVKRIIENFKLKNEQTCYILFIRRQFDFSDWAYTALAHECLHLASYFLRDFLDITKEDEAFAYTHTYLMENCLKKLRNG